MTSPIALLSVLLAALAVSEVAHAEGTLRFGGRIVEAPCTLQSSAADRAITLAGCPLAASGSILSIRHIEAAETARLVDVTSGIALRRVALHAQSIGSQAFSSRYIVEAPVNADAATHLYQVSVDYL